MTMKDPLTNLNYGSTTPISTAQDVSTIASIEDCECDLVAKQIAMTAEEQLAFRLKALNAAEPWALDGQANELPHFQAGEIED
jgi:hypothetical protein